MDTEVTRVVFRKWRYQYGGDIIALFPYNRVALGECSSYEHIGQHGATSYSVVISRTIPAVPADYQELKAELESIGYNLKVIRNARGH